MIWVLAAAAIALGLWLWRFNVRRRRRTIEALQVGMGRLARVMFEMNMPDPDFIGGSKSMLHFESGDERFAIDANQLVDIIMFAPEEQWNGKLRFLIANATPLESSDDGEPADSMKTE